jgi:signal peptidase I
LGTIAKRFIKNEYLQTIFVILLVITIVFGIWYGSQIILNTSIPPALAVISGSMDMTSYGQNQGGINPFARTLQIGDLIIIQGVDADSLNVDYPDSDIIVFHRPDNPTELIVHRIVSKITIDEKLYFFTKGDGNPPVIWPNFQEGMYDPWFNSNSSIPRGAVNEGLVIGKVIMRIPLIGYIPMTVQAITSGNPFAILPIIIILVILLILIEVVLPMIKRKEAQIKQNPETEPRTAPQK